MANRFPLILNSNSNQIQELAATDTLDLTGSGLNLTGITTLSTGAQLNLGGGTNINTGSRGDILFYNSAGRIEKLSLGATGKILKSNGTDLVYGDSGSIANVYYVSPSGTDASGFGGSVDRPFKTIKYASANIGTPTSTNPAILFIKAGTYEEAQLPIVVPPHTTIAGDSLRATIIKPASGLDSSGSVQNNRSTMFRMSDATVLQDLVMDGMGGYTPGSPNFKPESATIGGIYLGFNSVSPILGKSPYIYNCTSFGNGATGALLDGALHASGNRSMLFHTYTAVHSDGLGIFLKNNANAEMISTFTYYCTVGFACIGGSKIRSLNSSNAYGEYAVYSAGFDAGETANTGTIKGTMLTYTNVLTTSFTNGEQITGGTSGATAYVVNVQSEPKVLYIVQKSGVFQASETVTGGSSGATATLAAGGSFETNQSGRILVTTFSTSPDAGDSLQFATTDGNAFQIQSVSSVTANSVAYHVLVFSTSRATPVAADVQVIVRKEFSLVRLTGHDFLQVGTGGTDTTNWPNNPSQNPSQADQVVTNSTDPGRVYYTATDELGNFYVGDQFKVDQATGNVTLDASAFNLSGLESLRLGSVGGLIGAAVGEFSTDGTLSQNSDTKVPTQKAVKTYVDTEVGGLNSVSGNFTVAGISTVTGTTHFTKQLNVAGVSTFHGNVNLLDGDRARFGSSEDLQIYHDSNHSYIAENGAVDLKIQASAGSIIIQKSDGEEMIKANVDGAVELYQDDVLRLNTTTTGVSIGGTLTVSGNVSIGGTLTYEDVTNVDSIGIVTARTGLVSPYADIDDFISVGSNIHLGNAGVVTATSFSGNGANITNVNATTLDSIDSGSFLRSDANDTTTGNLTFNSSADEKIVLKGSSNPYIRFREGDTNKAYIQWNSSGYLEIYNQGTSRSIRLKGGTNGLIYNENGTERIVIHSENATSQLTQFARSDADDTLSGDITLSSTNQDCLNFSGNASSDRRGIAFNGRIALSADYNDGYLRINDASEFSNGVYTPSVMRADGGFLVSSNTVINSSGQLIAGRLTGALPAIDGSALTGVGGGLQSVQYFTSSGTWTKPSGITKIRVFVTGGGGGGGSHNSDDAQGGGGAGGTAIEMIDVTSVSSVSVTIGNGGTGSSGNSNSGGSNGGTSSFGSYCSASGGSRPLNWAIGGNGGVGSGGDLNLRGGGGVAGNIDGQGNEESGGTGGASYWGGGPFGGSVWGGRGSDGAPGSGGAGTHPSTNNQGSNGKNGIVVVEEYA